MFRKYLIALVVAVFLVSSIQIPPSLAVDTEDSPITYKIPDGDFWKRVPTDLKWRPDQIAAAEMVIAQDKQNIQKQLDKAKENGAVKIRTKFFDWYPDEYLRYFAEYRKLTKPFVLIGTDSSNKKVFKGIWFKGYYLPQDARNIGSYLTRLKSNTCDLIEFSLFNPASWFANPCEIITAKPRDYLRATLISRINYPNDPEHEFGWLTSVLESTLEGKADYKIIDDEIHNSGIDTVFGKCGIPLKYRHREYYGYVITPGIDKWHMTFTQINPTIQQLANHLLLQGEEGDYALWFDNFGWMPLC